MGGGWGKGEGLNGDEHARLLGRKRGEGMMRMRIRRDALLGEKKEERGGGGGEEKEGQRESEDVGEKGRGAVGRKKKRVVYNEIHC